MRLPWWIVLRTDIEFHGQQVHSLRFAGYVARRSTGTVTLIKMCEFHKITAEVEDPDT